MFKKTGEGIKVILEVVSEYYNFLERDQHHRYKSWEHCYGYFGENYKDMSNPEISDKACLHLAFYLASWGMLRGGAFLLQKDYKIHQYFIDEVVSNAKYYHFFNREILARPTKDMYQNIDEMIKDIRDTYTNHIEEVNGQKQAVRLTDTLVSKILLGVYGNVPAYDRYFVAGIKLFGINTTLSKISIEQLINFFYTYENEFIQCHQYDSLTQIQYVPMKWIDMFFWQVGYMLEEQEIYKDKLEDILKEAEIYRQSNKPIHRSNETINNKVIHLSDRVLSDHIKGRSLTAKVIPTVASLKNMLHNLETLNWDEDQLKPWDKRSFKGYKIEKIKNQLITLNEAERKALIRQHILNLKPHEIGAHIVDIYIVGYVNQIYGQGKEILAKWLKEEKVTDNEKSVGAIWQVGKGDGVYLEILNKDGSICDWGFMYKWLYGK